MFQNRFVVKQSNRLQNVQYLGRRAALIKSTQQESLSLWASVLCIHSHELDFLRS